MKWRARQFHNQPERSHQHQFLEALWAQVAKETGGRLQVAVHPHNAGLPGSDPQALELLQEGSLEFFTVMGGILGRKVPVAELQGVPFAFASHDRVHEANDGALGELIGRECLAQGLYRFPQGLLENGFRQISTIERPIRTAGDLRGIRLRVPDGRLFRDLFGALEAEPVTVNIRELYDALAMRRVDGHENPLVIMDVNRLWAVTKYVSVTNHSWSGFNLLANLAFWKALPADIQEVVQRNVRHHVRLQRARTDRLNRELAHTLGARGLIFNTADAASFRARLAAGGFYQRWKRELGTAAWAVLEQFTGRLA